MAQCLQNSKWFLMEVVYSITKIHQLPAQKIPQPVLICNILNHPITSILNLIALSFSKC